MTAPDWREDTLHRTRTALGERLQRELQRQTQGRTAERGDLLLNDGGKGADRTMAQALQHHQAAQFAGLQAARATDHRASPRRSALRCREAAGYSPLNRQSKLTADTKRGGRANPHKHSPKTLTGKQLDDYRDCYFLVDYLLCLPQFINCLSIGIA